MNTETSAYIRAPRERIFALAADIQNWPEILPHYRFVHVLDESQAGRRKVVEMSAVREGVPLPGARFPVTWRSVQLCDPDAGQIIFKHLAGLATGMWVEWNFEDDPWERGVKVTISHHLTYPIGLLNGVFAKDIVGELFVSSIAGRTLATIKELAEAEEQDRLAE